MKALPVEIKRQLAELEQTFRDEGAIAELEAARELARDGLPVGQIFVMLRGVVSKPAIVLLIAEAKAGDR
jgi:hypothetical protein